MLAITHVFHLLFKSGRCYYSDVKAMLIPHIMMYVKELRESKLSCMNRMIQSNVNL